ncbi:flagellar basal body P-ring protein FlgI [bacterium]|nr:flagellar basal body P-ring protein FlgI [bacterium]
MISIIRIFAAILFFSSVANAVRLKDIANVRGVRDNQLIGYGLVVGLKGTGDSKSEFTNKSMARMLDKLGVKVEDGDIAKKNVAGVLITATLPPFARAGNKMDITVNSIGDASSLEGGTLVQSPLRASDQNVYAVAQGAISVGRSSGKAVHSTVGSISGGAIIEKDILQDNFTNRKMYRLTLHNPDITTAVRISQTVNMDLGGKYATAVDPATVDIVVPFSYEGKGVELLATIESLNVEPDLKAKVVINEKTGTVIIGENVRISTVAISHGDINLKVGAKPEPAPMAQAPIAAPADAPTPPTPVAPMTPPPIESVPLRAPAAINVAALVPNKKDAVKLMQESVSVGELVQSLNQMGVSPKDLIVILQNIKASGALQGELEIL